MVNKTDFKSQEKEFKEQLRLQAKSNSEWLQYQAYCNREKLEERDPMEYWAWTEELQRKQRKKKRQWAEVREFFFAGPGLVAFGPVVIIGGFGIYELIGHFCHP